LRPCGGHAIMFCQSVSGMISRSCGRERLQEVSVFPSRRILLVLVAALLFAGCAVTQRAEEPPRPEGPFDVAILAVSDTRGELEPCG